MCHGRAKQIFSICGYCYCCCCYYCYCYCYYCYCYYHYCIVATIIVGTLSEMMFCHVWQSELLRLADAPVHVVWFTHDA